MYEPLSACGDCQIDFPPKHLKSCGFSVPLSYRMIPSDLPERHPETFSVLQNILSDPSSAPVMSSVWLEQGEYFFDDEFAVPFDADSQDNLQDLPSITDRTVLTVADRQTHGPSQLDQSCSDSCICTPGDSGESGLASTQNERLCADGCHVGDSTPNNCVNDFRPNTGTTAAVIKSNISNNTSEVPTTDRNRNVIERKISENQAPLSFNGIYHQSTNGSEISGGHSGSTSWMQMIMERSCNPDLKALLSRAAATADYKLAYADALPLDSTTSSVIRQTVQSTVGESNGPNGLLRSLSQNNLLSPASLVGLRHALDQATQFLPKTDAPFVPLTAARSIGITASLATHDRSGEPSSVSESIETANCNVTTWAQRRTSRESLRRKQSKVKDVTVLPNPISLEDPEEPLTQKADHSITPWRAIKHASGALITWNQLKRTVKKDTSLTRAVALRESRYEHHGRLKREDMQNVNVTSDTQLLDNFQSRPLTRSRSQPITSNQYMHRFSGTLLEIFMRAKTEEKPTLNAFGHTLASNEHFSATGYPSHFQTPFDSHNPRVPTGYLHTGSGSTSIAETTYDAHLFDGTSRLPRPQPMKSLPEQNANTRSVRHFGAQFPPVDFTPTTEPCTAVALVPMHRFSPTWSTALPVRRLSATGRTVNHPEVRYSHPKHPLTPDRPQSLNLNRQIRRSLESKSTNASPDLGTCLTASAGTDSPYLAALRADHVMIGYSPGWFRNPRASIAYPGLGLLSVPRPSRLTSTAFLSHTLPDLSFLGQAGAEEERKGTPTMPKRVACRCRCNLTDNRYIKCGCRSASVGRTTFACFHNRPQSVGKGRRAELRTYTFSPETLEPSRQPAISKLKPQSAAMVPDLVAGHANPSSVHCIESDNSSSHPDRRSGTCVAAPLHSDFGCQNDRFTSEPDLNSALMHSSSPLATEDDPFSYMSKPCALMTSSSQACYGWDSNKSSILFDRSCRPKKSVSFSGNIRLLRTRIPHNGAGGSPTSPEPKVIPRNWGLYGQETPLAEFNPRSSPGRDAPQSGELTVQSDVDVRYHALVNDVIKAVQHTVAYYSTTSNTMTNHGAPNCIPVHSELLFPYSTLSGASRQPTLAVVGPLTVLLCDGLLPPTRPIFMSKPRTRLWQMVEESCRPGPLLTGVAFRVLSDALAQVKALPSVTLERAKFKAFLCACLNAKALPMWLNAVVSNAPLLNRFYYADSFLRECRSRLRGLYADLLTHLEQLLAYPFNLDVAVEARKPLSDPLMSMTKFSGPSNSLNNSGNSTASKTSAPKLTARPSAPPAVVMTRKVQSADVSGTPNNRNRFSPAPSNTTTNVIHHYPPHHLPGQRPLPPTRAPTRPSTLLTDDSDGSSVHSGTTSKGQAKVAAGKRGVNVPAAVTTSPVRGRLKTALSTFRRTTTPVSVSDKRPNSIKSPTACTVESGTKMVSKLEAPTCRRAPVIEGDRGKHSSKLKQPSAVSGSR